MITNKTTFLQFIKQHVVDDVQMKDLRNARAFSRNQIRYFNVVFTNSCTQYHISIMQFLSGKIHCSISRYIIDEDFDTVELYQQGTMELSPDGVVLYDSYHFKDIYISKQ